MKHAVVMVLIFHFLRVTEIGIAASRPLGLAQGVFFYQVEALLQGGDFGVTETILGFLAQRRMSQELSHCSKKNGSSAPVSGTAVSMGLCALLPSVSQHASEMLNTLSLK